MHSELLLQIFATCARWRLWSQCGQVQIMPRGQLQMLSKRMLHLEAQLAFSRALVQATATVASARMVMRFGSSRPCARA